MTAWIPRMAAPVVAVTLLACAVAACGPSEASETRKWDANQLLMQEFSGKFAALKPAFEARAKEAQAAWDKAKAIGNEEERAQAMRKANELLDVMLTPAQDLDRKFREIDQLRTDPTLVTLPAYMLNPVLQASDWQVQQVRTSLQTGVVATPGEAIGRLRDANTHLVRAREPLDRLKAQVAERQRAQNANAAPGTAAPGQVAPGTLPPGTQAPGALPPGQLDPQALPPAPGVLPPAAPAPVPDPNGPPGNVPLQPLPPPGVNQAPGAAAPGTVPPGTPAPGAPPAPAAKPF